MKTVTMFRVVVGVLVAMAVSPPVVAVPLSGGPLNMASEPIYLGVAADPNLLFSIDDSGSMLREYMPDEANDSHTCKSNTSCSAGKPPFYANEYNTLFYNPDITYVAPINNDGYAKPDQNSANTSAWTAVKRNGFIGTSTDNINQFPDIEYCGNVTTTTTVTQTYLSVFDGAMNQSTAPAIDKTSGKTVTVKVTGHGLNDGDLITISDSTSAGSCHSRYKMTTVPITYVNADTFTYQHSNNNTSNTRNCKIERPGGTFTNTTTTPVCLRNGIDTNNPFEYRTPPSPTTEDPMVHGLPADIYTSSNNVTTAPFFYVIIPTEYCSDKKLTNCVAATTPTTADPYAAPVRFCTSQANADANVPVSDSTKCQGTLSGSYTFPRYGKFYRQNIVTGTTYSNVFIDSYGNLTNSASAPVDGYAAVINRSNRSDCSGACTYDQEMTNFANWYAYYRTRINAMKSSVGRAFDNVNGGLRIGFATINTGVQLGVRDFSGAYKNTFYTQLNAIDPPSNQGTPLRQALHDAGQYYSQTASTGPWGTNPQTGQVKDAAGNLGAEGITAQSACRQSYFLLSSDGYYNGSDPGFVNEDQLAGPPFADVYSDTLADAAYHYWETDLRSGTTTGLANNVPVSTADTANWQHMVTFTMGFGVKGTLDPDVDLPFLSLPDTYANHIDWPQASDHQVDDMWHASINGRGKFFSAKNPTELIASLNSTLTAIDDRRTTAGSVSLNSTSLSSGTSVYKGGMNTGDWSGTLESTLISDGPFGSNCPSVALGFPCPTNAWEAGALLTAHLTSDATYFDTTRKIATYDPYSHVSAPFRWANLTVAQKTVMKTNPDNGNTDSDAIGTRRLEYLRGKNDSLFRARSRYLGDIGYSYPVYVAANPVSRYPDIWPGSAAENNTPYSGFAPSRSAMVYVGANDGMLHAFDASSGEERFAYVPSPVYGTVDAAHDNYGQLNQLTSDKYPSNHRYFVDGTLKSEDVFIAPGGSGTADWHTVLVGSLRGGGRGIYALDVTTTAVANESAVASKVLWEFTDSDDADLGLTFGEPYIARMQNGRWAVVIGNGYNNSAFNTHASTTGHAVLYILYLDANASDGWDLDVDYIKIDTNVGSAAIPNGLASPAVADVDGDIVADYIYAGDLEGNMWKFDVTSATDQNWATAFGTSLAPEPLFTAVMVDGYGQAITTRPEVGKHPSIPNSYMIYFGTGKDIEASDNQNVGRQTQSFYGIWDKNGQSNGTTGSGYTAFGRASLLAQSITSEDTYGSIIYRQTSSEPIAWHTDAGNPTSGTHLGWYMDLLDPANTTDNRGERQSTNSILRNGRIIFTTQIPSTDPCQFGGSGHLMVLDATDGSMLSGTPFLEPGGPSTASGRGFTNLPSAPVFVEGQDKDFVYVSDSTGDTAVVELDKPPADNGRRSWQQLQ